MEENPYEVDFSNFEYQLKQEDAFLFFFNEMYPEYKEENNSEVEDEYEKESYYNWLNSIQSQRDVDNFEDVDGMKLC